MNELQADPSPDPVHRPAAADMGIWLRIREHKIIQWSLGYLAAALALTHAEELIAHAYGWPESVGQILIALLGIGLPVAVTLAWYHGHRASRHVTGAEATIIAILLLLGAGFLWLFVRPHESAVTRSVAERAATPITSPVTSAAVPQASIAVVPFLNLTGDPSKEYFSDGMAEELINALANVPGLKVASRISSFAYKGRNMDIRQIARDLEVAMIVEGSVQSAGERIRVTVQLINAQTGYHVWSHPYDRQYADIFKLEDELASEIVKAFRDTGTSLPTFATQRPPTQDLGAYDLYLQAITQVQARQGPETLSNARALLERALARDPQFALAQAWLSIIGAFAGQPPEVVERDAKRALELDPSLKITYQGLAFANLARRQWIDADRNFRIALNEQNPAWPVNSNYGAFLLLPVGHLHEALHETLEGYRRAPAFPPFAALVANANAALGRYSEAVRYAQLAEKLSGVSDTRVYMIVALGAGRYDEAAGLTLPTLPAAMRQGSGENTVRQVFAAMGDARLRPEAAKALEQLMNRLKPSETGGAGFELQVAVWYSQLGALDQAYELAERGLNQPHRQGDPAWGILWTPQARAFRQDPRFQALATRLGFMDYWQQYGPPDECDLDGDKLTCR